jgi:hypothetical protein
MPPFTTSFSRMTPRTRGAVGDDERRAAARAIRLDVARRPPRGQRPPCRAPTRATASTAPLRTSAGAESSTPLMRVVRREGHETAPTVRPAPLADAVLLLRQDDDARALGRLVGERRELRRVGQLRSRDARAGRNSAAWRLPSVIVPVLSSRSTSTSPAASTARPDMAITLCCMSRSMPAMPMAESRPPIVVGMRHTSSATSTSRATAIGARVEGEGAAASPPRRGRRSSGRRGGCERDLVRRLLPFRRPRRARSSGRGRSEPGSAVTRTTMPSDRTACRRSPPSGRRPPRG